MKPDDTKIDYFLSLCQILVVKSDPSDEDFDNKFKAELWIGPKDKIAEKLHLDPEKFHVPSAGVMLDEDFSPGDKPIDVSTQQGARFLLQTRLLSQLVAQSWLEGSYADRVSNPKPGTLDKDKDRNRIIRKLFLTANLEPDAYSVDIPDPNDPGKKESLLQLSNFFIEINKIDPKLKEVFTRIIFPQEPGWDLIRITLLFAGQVFWTKDDGQSYERLIEPILSTYEITMLYAFTSVDWGTYVATQIEMIQPGKMQRPGHYEITMPYPPRPSSEDTTTTPDQVYSWAYADLYEMPGIENPFPFYSPCDENNKFVSTFVGTTYPPFPYIPVSTC
uniref:Putative peptide n=1 Tax=Prochloron didemni P2-Fiji TaxID=910454 RepID=G0XS54_PRODI|nr:putative precursor peptide [Prochloron didemni P2-Fiji]